MPKISGYSWLGTNQGQIGSEGPQKTVSCTNAVKYRLGRLAEMLRPDAQNMRRHMPQPPTEVCCGKPHH